MTREQEQEIKSSAQAIIQDILDYDFEGKEELIQDEFGEAYYAAFLGSYLSLNPSGKYYMPWTSNQTDEDTEADELFWTELESNLPNGYWIQGSEGDPLDIFICKEAIRNEED